MEERKKLGLKDGKCSSISGMSDDGTSMDFSMGEPEIDVVGEESGDDDIQSNGDENERSRASPHSNANTPGKPILKSAFSIASLLEAPKVPRGRRPNSKYPRVQASKSMNPLSLGMYPLFPITQPVGFQVEQPLSPHLASPPRSPEPGRTFTSPSAMRANHTISTIDSGSSTTSETQEHLHSPEHSHSDVQPLQDNSSPTNHELDQSICETDTHSSDIEHEHDHRDDPLDTSLRLEDSTKECHSESHH